MPSANMLRHEAWNLEGTDLVLTWGDAAFSIDVQGTLLIEDSMVRGADHPLCGHLQHRPLDDGGQRPHHRKMDPP